LEITAGFSVGNVELPAKEENRHKITAFGIFFSFFSYS
jgi:hypothetical protein